MPQRSLAGCGDWNDRGPLFLGEGDAIAEGDELAGVGGNAWAGHKDSGQVERVSGGNCDEFAGGLLLAHGAERFHRDGQSELFSEESANKAAAADFAAIFEPAQGD